MEEEQPMRPQKAVKEVTENIEVKKKNRHYNVLSNFSLLFLQLGFSDRSVQNLWPLENQIRNSIWNKILTHNFSIHFNVEISVSSDNFYYLQTFCILRQT